MARTTLCGFNSAALPDGGIGRKDRGPQGEDLLLLLFHGALVGDEIARQIAAAGLKVGGLQIEEGAAERWASG